MLVQMPHLAHQSVLLALRNHLPVPQLTTYALSAILNLTVIRASALPHPRTPPFPGTQLTLLWKICGGPIRSGEQVAAGAAAVRRP